MAIHMTPASQSQSSHLLLRDSYHPPIEEAVSEHLGREWKVTHLQDKNDDASHSAAILSDSSYAVFVKLGEGELAIDRFQQESHGLQLLSGLSGVRTPTVLRILGLAQGAMLVMEAFTGVEQRKTSDWRQLGHELARVHQVKSDYCGLDVHSYWGDLYQDNTPTADWFDFYVERRLMIRLQAAIDSGNLPLTFIKQVESVANRLPQLGGPKVQPSLLHGDAHHNNLVTSSCGPVFIDPAVHYGHPELDLAYVDFFGPVPKAFFEGYTEVQKIDDEFSLRRDLWRIHAWLGMVEVAGPAFIDNLASALHQYR